MKCRCGKLVHPLYGGRCEDCWADDQGPPQATGRLSSFGRTLLAKRTGPIEGHEPPADYVSLGDGNYRRMPKAISEE